MGTAKKIGVVLEVIGIVGVVLMDLGFITDWLEFLLARVILVPVSTAEVWFVLLVNAIFLYCQVPGKMSALPVLSSIVDRQ